MEKEKIVKLVDIAIKELLNNDSALFQRGVNERAIAARFSNYLQNNFEEYSVDADYNRHGVKPKRVELPEECRNKKDEKGNSLIIPDIVIHDRGNDDNNLLAIELKKDDNAENSKCDDLRVQALIDQLNYEMGLTIRFSSGQKSPSVVRKKWFEKNYV